jgi:hypothetical protein
MTAGGKLHMLSNSTLIINAGANNTVTMSNGWTLTNDGTVNWQSGTIAFAGIYPNNAITNNTDGIFNIQGNLNITYNNAQANIKFNNLGIVKKTTGNGNANLQMVLLGNAAVVLAGTITWA